MAEALGSAKGSRLHAAVVRGLREGALFVFGALALVLVLALLSFDPADRSFTNTGDPGRVANWIGPIGAWTSDLFLALFGAPAFLFPVMLAVAGWTLFRPPAAAVPSRANIAFRLAGFVLTLATSAGIATLHFASGRYTSTAGGVLGDLVGHGLARGFSFLGATLLLLGFWFAGVSLFAGVSWLRVMDLLGHGILSGQGWLKSRLAQRRDRSAGRENKAVRQEAAREEKKKAEFRPPPRIEPAIPVIEKSERVEKERQVVLFDKPASKELPALSLLDDAPPREAGYSAETLEAMSRLVELKLRDFGVEVEVVAVHPGPVVTRFEMRPAPGVKASQITALSKDLARALSTISVRVVEVIPGKSVMGLEIPNEKRELVTLGEIIKSKAYEDMDSPLALALGKNIGGVAMVADLQRMPHLLIAGTTGSGKSVAINAMILSLVYKASAEHVRLIMIDPKMLELSVYEGIPHLLAPVVTDMKQAANALRWCVAEMERRYQLMAALGVRNIAGYNKRVGEANAAGKPIIDPVLLQRAANDPSIDQRAIPNLEPLPFVVVVIDELADLMMIVGKKVEELIARLAQKARASGIHLVLATQRPSVDVITGLIKANIPARIAFQVSARVDSRTILDQQGAEALLGHGDMLYLPGGTSVPTRIHGAFVSDQEVHKVVAFLKRKGEPRYMEEILQGPSEAIPGFPNEPGEEGEASGEADPLYYQAVRIVTESRR